MKTTSFLSYTATAAFVCGLLSPSSIRAAASEPVEMKLDWQVGKKYKMRTQMTQRSEISVPSLPEPMLQQMNFQQEYAIKALRERPGGGRELELEFTGMKLDMKMNGVPVFNFDSKTPSGDETANPALKPLRKVIGSRIQYVTDARGEVIEVKGAKEIVKGLGSDDPQTEALLQGLFNEDSLKQMYAFSKTLPPKPVKVGDTWPVKLEMNAGPVGTIILNLDYTFKGWEQREGRKTAILQYTGTMSTKPGTTSADMGDVSVQNAKMVGTNWYDPAVGMVVSGDGRHEMSIKFSPGGQTIISKINQDIKNELIGISAATK